MDMSDGANTQGGPPALTGALNELTSASQSLLAMLVMLFILASLPLLISSALLFLTKGRQGGGWKKISIWVGALGALSLILALVSAAIYILAPTIIQSLIGG